MIIFLSLKHRSMLLLRRSVLFLPCLFPGQYPGGNTSNHVNNHHPFSTPAVVNTFAKFFKGPTHIPVYRFKFKHFPKSQPPQTSE